MDQGLAEDGVERTFALPGSQGYGAGYRLVDEGDPVTLDLLDPCGLYRDSFRRSCWPPSEQQKLAGME